MADTKFEDYLTPMRAENASLSEPPPYSPLRNKEEEEEEEDHIVIKESKGKGKEKGKEKEKEKDSFFDKIKQTTNIEEVSDLLDPTVIAKLPVQTATAVTHKMKKDLSEMKEINERVKWKASLSKAKLPILGIFLLLFECNRGIMRSCLGYFIVLFIISIITFILLLVFVFVPQSIILQTFFNFDPSYSYIYSMYLVFVESSYIMLLISLVFSGRVQRTLFDLIFRMYNVKVRSLHEMTRNEKIKTILIRISVPFLVLIITFPFNVIPFLGTLLWILVYSLLNAWSIQSLYFSYKGLSIARQSKWISARYPEYICFGIPAVLLLSIPILSSLFFFTNIIGSAVWAVQLERNRLFRHFVRKQSIHHNIPPTPAGDGQPPVNKRRRKKKNNAHSVDGGDGETLEKKVFDAEGNRVYYSSIPTGVEVV